MVHFLNYQARKIVTSKMHASYSIAGTFAVADSLIFREPAQACLAGFCIDSAG
jgi:hypothetical protein